MVFNPSPNDKFLAWPKLKELADDKLTMIKKKKKKMKFLFGRAENIVGKGENAGYQHFLLFLQCFQKASFPESLKVGIVRERVNAVFQQYISYIAATSAPIHAFLEFF